MVTPGSLRSGHPWGLDPPAVRRRPGSPAPGVRHVVVAGDRLLTMYSDGQNDQVICLNRNSGETLWQVPVGPAFRGDLSQPAVGQGQMFS